MLEHDRDEEVCVEMDDLAEKDFSHFMTESEYLRYKQNWWISLNKSGNTGPLRNRSDFNEALSTLNRLYYSRTFDQSDKALGMCFAYVERAARRGCRTCVALRSQDPTCSNKILIGLMKTPESRQCHGGLLDSDSHRLGLVMIWEGQEVCDVLEVTQVGSRCDYRSKITHDFMTGLHDGASKPKPMWTGVGVWGNTLVRASDVQQHRSVTSYTGRPTWKGVQLFKSHQSLRVLREEENDRTIGGVRNPTRAVAGNPASRHVGSQIRVVLDKVLAEHPQFVGMVSELRSTTNRDVAQLSRLAVQVGTVAAQEVVVSLGFKCGIERAHGRYRAELVAELMNAMHDPDKEVALWLRGHTPVGIPRPFGGLPNCVSDQSPDGIITVLLPDPGKGRVHHSEPHLV